MSLVFVLTNVFEIQCPMCNIPLSLTILPPHTPGCATGRIALHQRKTANNIGPQYLQCFKTDFGNDKIE